MTTTCSSVPIYILHTIAVHMLLLLGTGQQTCTVGSSSSSSSSHSKTPKRTGADGGPNKHMRFQLQCFYLSLP
ncbi:hypothetical protein GLYMA_04G248951v4 [Glycine max]|nr:hypothetical protein GLYMA_04G248951v4 [Glycine max]KAH1113097.1 hypothetical protein GYH30_011024 [Glycine max]